MREHIEQKLVDHSLVGTTAHHSTVITHADLNWKDVRYQFAYNPQPLQLTTNRYPERSQLPALSA